MSAGMVGITSDEPHRKADEAPTTLEVPSLAGAVLNMPRFSDLVQVPSLADAVLRAAESARPSGGLDDLARSLFQDLSGGTDDPTVGVVVSDDDYYYGLIAAVAPQVAAAIDAAASLCVRLG